MALSFKQEEGKEGSKQDCQLELINGDKISGVLHRVDEKSFHITYAENLHASFDRDKVQKLTNDKFLKELPGKGVVELLDGTAIPGELKEISKETLTLQSSLFFGDLLIKRSQVKSLSLETKDHTLYKGFSSRSEYLSSWDGVRGWTWKNGEITSSSDSASLTLKQALPKNFHIKMKLFAASYPQAELTISNRKNKITINYYGYQLTVRIRSNDFGRSITKNFNLNDRSRKSKQIDLYFKQNEKVLYLYVDGKKIGEVQDDILGAAEKNTFSVAAGKGLTFKSFFLSEWDGEFFVENKKKNLGKQDLLQLVNGEVISCEILGRKGAYFLCVFEGEELEIPMKNIKRCVFSQEKGRKVLGKSLPFRAKHAAGEFYFELISLEKEFCLISHPAFAEKLKIRASLFSEIERNKNLNK